MCTYNGNFCPIYLLCIWRRYNIEQSSITTPQHPEKIPRWIPMTKLIRESLVLLYLFFKYLFHIGVGFPGGSGVKKKKKKNPPATAGDMGILISGSGKSPGKGNGNPLQCSCLENPMNREAWWATVHWVAKEVYNTEWLNNNNRVH